MRQEPKRRMPKRGVKRRVERGIKREQYKPELELELELEESMTIEEPPVGKSMKGWKVFLLSMVGAMAVVVLLTALASEDAPGWALPVALVVGVIMVGGIFILKRRSK